MKNKYIETIGWIGMVLILVAYFLVSFSIITVQDIIYQLLNMVGSVGIILVAFSKKDYQPMVLNIIWVLIAVIALLRIVL